MSDLTKVFLRADGNSQIGLGHIHRLLALSETLKDSFHCVFVTRSALPGIRELMLENCQKVFELGQISLEEELQRLKTLSLTNEIFVLDGYHFNTDYQKKIRDQGHAVVCIDDIQNYHFVADVIINPAGGVDEEKYSKEDYTQLYSGPKYAFLKKPFLNSVRDERRNNPKSILICMGGADPHNFTQATFRECVKHPFEKYYVVVGEAYLHKEKLMDEIRSLSSNVEILTNLKPQKLADIMSLCSTAVCSASGIAYEYSTIGGELYLRKTAQNQTLLHEFLLQRGLAFSFDQFPVEAGKATDSISRQREIFDGKSGKRLRSIFIKVDFDQHMTVRRMKDSDSMTLFIWANDPLLRSQSYNSNPISLEDHKAWLSKKLTDPNCHLYIFEYKNIPVAQVRFEVKQEAVISYSVDKEFRGKGWGRYILHKAIETFESDYVRKIKVVGYVKFDNVASNKIFERLGFARMQTSDYPNSYKYEYVSHGGNKNLK